MMKIMAKKETCGLPILNMKTGLKMSLKDTLGKLFC